MNRQYYFENQLLSQIKDCDTIASLKTSISQYYLVGFEDLYATVNGKRVPDDLELKNTENVVRVFTKLVGGKGGFGSMLRAIGAQIEKTTNREACRDLSGRRLRDINEEKRLRKWLDGRADREREAAERKIRKLERLVAEPTVDSKLDDPAYEKERQALPERVSAAVDAGLQAAGSSTNATLKRKADDDKKAKDKKKSKLWIDADLSDCSTESDDDEETAKPTVSTDSGNESDKSAKAQQG